MATVSIHGAARDISMSFLRRFWRHIVFPEPFYQQRGGRAPQAESLHGCTTSQLF